jgi:hypothetical protein
MRSRYFLILGVPVVALGIVIVLIASCSGSAKINQHPPVAISTLTPTSTDLASGSSTGTPVAGATGAPTPASTTTPVGSSSSAHPTPKPAPQITSCTQISGFSSAGSASAGKHFTDFMFPPNSRSFVIQTSEANGYQFQVMKACTSNDTITGVRSFYQSSFASHGWSSSSTIPINGNPSTACGSAICWKQGTSPTRYADVDVQSGEGNFGSVTVYQLRVFVAPLASGTKTFMPNGTLVLDPTGSGEYVWDGGTNHINLAGGATQVSFDTSDFASITLGDLEGTSYGGGFIDPTRTDLGNFVSGVKSGNGHFSKWHILSNNGNQMQIIFVTYAYSIS